MGAFTVKASPVATYNEKRWRCDLLIRLSAADEPEVFASVYGDTKELATIRAEFTALLINKGNYDVK